jgi:hypothetical protein
MTWVGHGQNRIPHPFATFHCVHDVNYEQQNKTNPLTEQPQNTHDIVDRKRTRHIRMQCAKCRIQNALVEQREKLLHLKQRRYAILNCILPQQLKAEII